MNDKIILTIGQLRQAIAHYPDNDVVVIEVYDAILSDDLYSFTIDSIGGIKQEDGSEINEVRLCVIP